MFFRVSCCRKGRPRSIRLAASRKVSHSPPPGRAHRKGEPARNEKRAADRCSKRKQPMTGELAHGEVAGKQRCGYDKAECGQIYGLAVNQAAVDKRRDRKHRRRMKQQHRGGRFKAALVREMGGGGRQRDAGSAHQAREDNQDACHDPRSLSSWATAARSAAMPSPEREEVTATRGNAAGCFERVATISSVRAASS